MKKFLTLTLVSLLSLTGAIAQGLLPYGEAYWDYEGLGNHRAVVTVSKSVDVVKVNVPWRRLDDVTQKNIIIEDAETGVRIENAFINTQNKEGAEVVFEPVSGVGDYYIYYMPSRNAGRWWHPNAEYEKPIDTAPKEWRAKYESVAADLNAKVVRFESQGAYDSFYPMEVPVTAKELQEILSKNNDKDYIVYTEDRKYPTRMFEAIPYRWYEKGAFTPFIGRAYKDESYTWQLGVYASKSDLDNVKIKFNDLEATDGTILPASAMSFFNGGGRNHLGEEFVKDVKIPSGEVRGLWVLTAVPEDQKAGEYKGKVTVSAANKASYDIDIIIDVADEKAVNHGYNTPQNMSRLAWFNSDMGVDDELFGQYTPVEIKGKTISVLGRKLTFNNFGFPARITTSFNNNNTEIGAPEKDILSSDMRLDVIVDGKPVAFKPKSLVITMHTEGAIAWETTLHSTDLNVTVKAKMECDGYVNYWTVINAKKDIDIEDIRLVVPYKKSIAKYFMGMGRRGGYTPESHDWKWEQEYANNMVWAGDVNAGMQVKLKHLVPDWKLGSFEKTGPYRDWSNNGKGGCKMRSEADNINIIAFTADKKLAKGEDMTLNFGLAITPFKTLNPDHWQYRYYHYDDVKGAIKNKARIHNIHQGGLLNPFINYPFLTTEALSTSIDEANKHGIKTKLYYTLRELSTYMCELWPMRHLDDEIFTRANVLLIADTHTHEKSSSIYGMTGHTWLYEHLRKDYDPAWHQPINKAGITWDMSIRTQGLSRLHNYYIEGLNWLVSNLGIRGLYLDGIGYDREIMKRIRKTVDRAANGCLFDIHSGDSFHPDYGLNSPVNSYMELLPYADNLWLGEMYDYNAKSDYWLIEISGIPFGLYGEMLEHCGNAYRGMVYGMSGRLYGGCDPTNMWALWDYFEIDDSETIGYWDETNPVKSSNPEVLASIFKKSDKTLVALGNWTDKDQQTNLSVDLAKLGYDPAKITVEIPEIKGLQAKSTVDISKPLDIPASKGLIIIINK